MKRGEEGREGEGYERRKWRGMDIIGGEEEGYDRRRWRGWIL